MSWILGLNAHEISTDTNGTVIAARESGYDVEFPNGIVGTYSWECSDIEIG